MERLTHLVLWLLVRNICVYTELTASEPNVCIEIVWVRLSRVIPETYINSNCDGHQTPCQQTRYKTAYVMEPKEVKRCCAGWIQADNCTQPCLNDTYGQDCNRTCNCTVANSYCNALLGCLCRPGFKPPGCLSPCDGGRYGYSCTQASVVVVLETSLSVVLVSNVRGLGKKTLVLVLVLVSYLPFSEI